MESKAVLFVGYKIEEEVYKILSEREPGNPEMPSLEELLSTEKEIWGCRMRCLIPGDISTLCLVVEESLSVADKDDPLKFPKRPDMEWGMRLSMYARKHAKFEPCEPRIYLGLQQI